MINNTYISNTADFGNDISSYATRIKRVVNGTELVDVYEFNDIPSGIVIDQPIELAVVSSEQNTIMTNDNSSPIKFEAFETGTRVRGQNIDTLYRGRAVFTNTIFIAKPGQKNVQFKLSSLAVNYAVLQFLDPVKYADQIISVNFRWCKPGEIEVGDT